MKISNKEETKNIFSLNQLNISILFLPLFIPKGYVKFPGTYIVASGLPRASTMTPAIVTKTLLSQ